MAIAIDFGTSNTVITRWNAATQQAETVSLPGLSQQIAENPPLIPSLLYVTEAEAGKVLIGQQVRDRGLDLQTDPRFFRSFKRGIGAEIQGFLPELDGKTVTFEQVGEWYLKTLLDQINQQITNQDNPPDSLVLTVPVDSFESYRNWLTGVCQSLNIDQVRILDEPTAAALGYGTTEQDVLLVVDFGGGTIDLSLVQLNLGEAGQAKPMGFILKWGEKLLGESSSQKIKTARVLAKIGQNLGGSDIDSWLVDYFAETQKVPKTSLISRLAERIKIQLSTHPDAKEVYFNDETLESYELGLNREQFRDILQQQNFFNQLDNLMTQVLQRGRLQGIETTDIDGVLLVGGTTQIPAVQEWVKQYFTEEQIKADRPFTAIATGALQLAQGFQLKDFLYHSYGIRYWNRRNNGHSWHPIIKAGQAYPMETPVELTLGPSVDNQPSLELIIGELGTATSSTEVYFDGDRLVTRTLDSGETAVKPLNDSDSAKTIATLSPPGNPGKDRVKIQFRVDEKCSLRITVEDLLTDRILLEDRPVVQLS
ncbi:Hsp70 family protein [Spirulina sp. CS-785/01]|uniref:Hsp70 family protein n=1 Tax=Spirulina sp. CS-785/01 TaxID=3021716 RepID=UPI00232E1415|nr:Hsp70 family protein [Spirulina sp. CS-785/01]MDB9311672.1 Hsp70 family protein [Spirulina sp. CS-785/01]